ncbi:MAG: hypothetical protein A2Y73_09035 [Chloroflexi bacterium RBG_13_56_8]|nr:MAG: hypothetical protein A2Y73_09035 [Chloroflexi bacterium RBG_13_56_8]
MPRIPVVQLQLNMELHNQLFLLRDKSVSSTRAGSSMLRVTLADRTGSLPGVYFDVPGHIPDALTVGKGVEVTGHIGEFRGQLQVNIERIRSTELTNLEEFLPMARRPLEEMKQELDALLASVEEPNLSRLLSAVFDDRETYQSFTQAPAAKLYHHACVGGLLEHTLSVARLVLAACEIYPELDRDLIITVALLHDLGKVRSYDPVSFDITEEGALWTHLYMGASQVEHIIDGIPDFPADLRLQVVHAILAHHGKLEHGSPVVPMTLEAIVLHYADNLDGDARGAIDHLGRAEYDGTPFSDYSTMPETRLYRTTEE